jgi:hypothetical protein
MRRLLVATAFSSLVLGISLGACSGSSEGGPCNVQDDNLGNDDCSGDLVCIAASGGKISGVYASYGDGIPGFGFCCPSNQAQATTAQCSTPQVVPGGNQGVADASADSSSSDGGDASTDSPADAPADSPSDAPHLDSSSDAPIDAPIDAETDAALDSSTD